MDIIALIAVIGFVVSFAFRLGVAAVGKDPATESGPIGTLLSCAWELAAIAVCIMIVF
jgi:hypothetical protein